MAIIAHLVVVGATQAIDFYKLAFGAIEKGRMVAEDGHRLMHAELQIGESTVYLCDDFPEYCEGKSSNPKALGATPVTLHQTVADCDAAIQQAAVAGATVTMPAMDMFWGDRYGRIRDPFGHEWSFSTPLKK